MRWFIPGKFRFCPACKDQPSTQAREINKLAGLSAEGRSSATTVLASSALRWMNDPEHGIHTTSGNFSAFTDNRQDAALQAGHFNDFLFVSLARARDSCRSDELRAPMVWDRTILESKFVRSWVS